MHDVEKLPLERANLENNAVNCAFFAQDVQSVSVNCSVSANKMDKVPLH